MRPVLAGTQLPYPTEYVIEREVMGGSQRMASGATSHTIVRPDRRIFELSFDLLVASERTALETAWGAIQQNAVTFTDMHNVSFIVKRHPDMKALRFDQRPARNGAEWVASTSLKLLEVLTDE